MRKGCASTSIGCGRSSSAPSRSARCTIPPRPRRVLPLQPEARLEPVHDPANQVEIAEPKIHHSVLKRIANNTSGYAPAGLPTSYRVVHADGAISDPDPDTYETRQAARRAELLERAPDQVFWRRVPTRSCS